MAFPPIPAKGCWTPQDVIARVTYIGVQYVVPEFAAYFADLMNQKDEFDKVDRNMFIEMQAKWVAGVPSL